MQTCLEYLEVAFTLRMLEDGRLPPFKGATLRGAFGHHLKRLACHVEHRDCGRCLLRTRCVFPMFFEGVAPEDRQIMRRYPFVPQPFLLVLEGSGPTEFQAGERLQFGLRIFGPAGEHLPYVAYTFMRIGEDGLGQGRMRFVVERIGDGQDVLFEEGDDRIETPAARVLPAPTDEAATHASEAEVEFVTPVRLREEGGLAKTLQFPHLFRSLVRRLSILSHFYGRWIGPPGDHAAVLDVADQVEIAHNGLRWVEFERFSTRQQVGMRLGGLVGGVTVRGPLGPLLPWLKAAEVVHVGKAASFGFGRVRTKVLDG